MYSDGDLHKGGVSPFGYPRINDRSHLPAAFRSVPRPSSPLGAKASTERPSLSPPTQSQARTQDQTAPHMHKTQEPGQRNTHTLTQSTNQPFHLHLSKEQPSGPRPQRVQSSGRTPMPTKSIERGERSLLDRQLVCKDRSQPEGIRPRRHDTFLERR